MKLRAVLAIALLGSMPLYAQQHLALDAATISRLGLVFQPVAAPDDADGARVPARVTASPQRPSSLFALHDGVLESWHVQAGQSVQTGDVVATLRSAAALQLQHQWVTAQAATQQASFELQRDKSLHEQGIIAEQRLRETERRAREATFALRAAEAALAQTGYSAEEVAALVSRGSEPGLYRVRAPFTGVIGQLGHVTGDSIAAGEALLSLRDDSLWVSAELPASLASRVMPDQALRLADSDATLVLRSKDLAIDQQTHTIGILAEFTTATTLLPGQIVTLLLPSLAEGIAVPADAVVRNGAETLVYVRRGEGVEQRVLQLQPLGANYLATSGLASGDELVVRGASLLKGITLGLGGE